MYVSWIVGKSNIGPILTFLSIILVFINGQYYSKQIIENYTYYKTIDYEDVVTHKFYTWKYLSILLCVIFIFVAFYIIKYYDP